jgi:muramoyltetrapeptide carboxypeptidase
VCARGGWGCHRIVERLDAARARAARKPLVGYSDVTTLLLWQQRAAGLAGIHGPMLERALGDDEFEALVELLTGTERIPLERKGTGGEGPSAEGRLVGGSLTLLAASLGTPWAVDTRDAILLLEDRGERPYRIDRLLEQLRCAGVFDRVAGIGFGRFEGCDEADGSITAAEILRELAQRAGVPFVEGLPFGHGAPNFAWPFGVRAQLDGDRATLQILERGVA